MQEKIHLASFVAVVSASVVAGVLTAYLVKQWQLQARRRLKKL